MINESDIARAIESTLLSYPELSGVVVEREVEINYDVENMPWVGVYPGEFSIDPATISINNCRWRTTYHPKIVLQEQSYDYKGQTASEKLSTLTETVLLALLSSHNPRLSFGLDGVRVVGAGSVRSYNMLAKDEEEGEELRYFPQAEITLDIEVKQ